jgi:hypothetical protein
MAHSRIVVSERLLVLLKEVVKRFGHARRQVRRPATPSWAGYLLEVLIPPELSPVQVRDLFGAYRNKFARVRKKHGLFLARCDFAWQVIRAAPRMLGVKFGLLAGLALFAKAIEFLQIWLGGCGSP